jgi:hypothetical protein
MFKKDAHIWKAVPRHGALIESCQAQGQGVPTEPQNVLFDCSGLRFNAQKNAQIFMVYT